MSKLLGMSKLLASRPTLDRIVSLSLLIDGYVRAMRDGEAVPLGDQHQRHSILARRSHHSIWPPKTAHRPADDSNESATGQWLDAFEFVQLARSVLEHEIEIHLVRLLDLCLPAPMHPNDVDPMNVIGR